MNQQNKSTKSSTSSISYSDYSGTSCIPFLPSQYYLVNIVEEKLIKFSHGLKMSSIGIETKLKAGFMKGSFKMEDGFEDPIDDFSEYV